MLKVNLITMLSGGGLALIASMWLLAIFCIFQDENLAAGNSPISQEAKMLHGVRGTLTALAEAESDSDEPAAQPDAGGDNERAKP